jgi:hypothetical protein
MTRIKMDKINLSKEALGPDQLVEALRQAHTLVQEGQTAAAAEQLKQLDPPNGTAFIVAQRGAEIPILGYVDDDPNLGTHLRGLCVDSNHSFRGVFFGLAPDTHKVALFAGQESHLPWVELPFGYGSRKLGCAIKIVPPGTFSLDVDFVEL